MREFLRVATERAVERHAFVVAMILGSILIAINHGDAIMRGDFRSGLCCGLG